VSAKDRATGKEQSMTITGQSSLAKDDIDRMVRDAEAHAEEDRRRKEEADTRNQADTLVYQTEKLLRENGDKIDASERSKVETAVGALKDSLAGADVEAIRRHTDQLTQVSQGFAQRLYEAASQQQAADNAAGSPGPSAAANDDEVVDAEIVDEPPTGTA